MFIPDIFCNIADVILFFAIISGKSGVLISKYQTYNFYRFFYLFLTDYCYDWFEEREYQVGGLTWRGVIFGLVMLNEPQSIEAVDFDD